jgi:DNA-binding NarL/FixJ family response regulator
VLVADDEALLRSAFSSLIEAQDDLEVVGAAANGQQAADSRRARHLTSW